ncbi:MAG: hypothetical protein FWE90_07195 [Defluviitaleaceae bacterium]|nr:hypothetical protein [Defluviitaleaceae bacterium]
MMRLDDLTDAQRMTETEAFRERQELRIIRGKIIVIVIALFIIAGAFINLISNFTLWQSVATVVTVCLAVALLKGVPWVRYFIIVSMLLGAFAVLNMLDSVPMTGNPVNYGPQISADFNTHTGETVYTVIETPNTPLYPAEGFAFFYWMLSALLLCYLICAALLIFNKSVKEYLYAVKY